MTRDEANHKSQHEGLLDPMFTKVVSKRQLEANRKNGAAGGRVSGIKKGFSALDPERARAIQLKGVATRKANKAKRDAETN